MSVYGLLNFIPIVCLVKLGSLEGISHSLKVLDQYHFKEKIYLWEHYLNEADKNSLEHLCQKYAFHSSWIEGGTAYIYDYLSISKNLSLEHLSVALLPWMLTEEEEVIVCGENICRKCLDKIFSPKQQLDKDLYFLASKFSFSRKPLKSSCFYMNLREIRKRFDFDSFIKVIKKEL